METKKLMRTRIEFKTDNPYGIEIQDVEKTYNMTMRDWYDRNPDIEVKDETGARAMRLKEYIAGIVELVIETKTVSVKQVKEEQSVEDQKDLPL